MAKIIIKKNTKNICNDEFLQRTSGLQYKYIVELRMYFFTHCFTEFIVNYGSKNLKDDNIEKWQRWVMMCSNIQKRKHRTTKLQLTVSWMTYIFVKFFFFWQILFFFYFFYKNCLLSNGIKFCLKHVYLKPIK